MLVLNTVGLCWDVISLCVSPCLLLVFGVAIFVWDFPLFVIVPAVEAFCPLLVVRSPVFPIGAFTPFFAFTFPVEALFGGVLPGDGPGPDAFVFTPFFEFPFLVLPLSLEAFGGDFAASVGLIGCLGVLPRLDVVVFGCDSPFTF